MRLAGLVAMGAASSMAGCGLFSLDGLAGGDAAADGAVVQPLDGSPLDGTGPADALEAAANDAAADDHSVPPVDSGSGDAANPGGPVTLAAAGSTNAPSGAAQQGHLAWTDGTQQWWLFYVDSAKPDLLQSVVSSDFVTWSPSTALTLPGAVPDGRNVAVWAGAAAGQAVLHLSISVNVSSTDRRHLHLRARPAGSALTFDPVVVAGTTSANLAGLDPDGPATTLGSDGTIVETSGWFEIPDSGAIGNSLDGLRPTRIRAGPSLPPSGRRRPSKPCPVT